MGLVTLIIPPIVGVVTYIVVRIRPTWRAIR
jgi:hypothetical protein